MKPTLVDPQIKIIVQHIYAPTQIIKLGFNAKYIFKRRKLFEV